MLIKGNAQIIAAVLLLSTQLSNAKEVISDSLQTATIVADRGMVVSKKEAVTIHQGESLPSVLAKVTGLSVTDYGSLAGLKSVSVRGMGAANTAIYIDGVRVVNVQSGQPDLGFVDLSNFSTMIVDYAQNSLSFVTSCPQFTGDTRFNTSVRLFAGSFSTYQPSINVEYKVSEKISAKANCSVQSSKGDFPYKDMGNSIVNRVNNDLFRVNSGFDLFCNLNNGFWHTKAYYSNTQRGVPGSLTYLEADSRQADNNAFVQFNLDNRFTKRYQLLLSSKLSFDDLEYSYSYANYLYNQKEAQINSSHIFTIKDWWKASFTADLSLAGLNSKENNLDYYKAKRASVHTALSTSFVLDKFSANAALLYNNYSDKGYAAKSCFSPSLDLHYRLNGNIKLSAFTRRAYRVPTFNDLYFPGMSNTDLKPEDSWLNDISLDYGGTLNEVYKLSAGVSLFYYALTNKIITMPDPNDPTGWTWLPFNIGTVHNTGLDAKLSFEKYSGKFKYLVNAGYSLQNALDMSDKTQIPYVPRHNFVTSITASYQKWGLSVNNNLKTGRHDSQGDLPTINVLDISLRRKIGNCLTATINATNLLNHHYDVVRYYPMPGISVTGGLEFTYPASKEQRRKLQQK